MTDAELTFSPSDRRAALAAWLTTERAAYAALALLALFTRLFGLAMHPLYPAEAAQALPAWQAAAGYDYNLSGASPLLFGLQRWLFVPLAGSAALARWCPALFGGLGTLLFYALRDRLGRAGALLAALLWALCPLAVFTGRLGLGYGLVPSLALAWLACLNLYLGTRSQHWLTWAGISLGALLAAGSGAYTALLIALVSALFWPRTAAVFLEGVRAHRRAVAGALLLSLVLSATSFLTAPAGLAALTDLLGTWARGLLPGGALYSAGDILRRLVLSEPLLVAFGLAGFVVAWRRRDGFGLWAGLAAGLALVVSLIGAGRHPADLGLVVVPLIFLAAPALAWALGALWSWRSELDPWLLLGLSLSLLAAVAISLPGTFNSALDEAHRSLSLGIGAATALLALALWVVYGFWANWQTVGRGIAITGLVLTGIWTLGQLNGINYEVDPLRHPAVLADTPGPGWQDLRTELRNLSALNGGGAREARIDVVLPAALDDPLTPLLRWAFRSYPAVRFSNTLPADPAPIVITPEGAETAIGERYGGASFTLLERWRPESLGTFANWLRWVIYREAVTPADNTWNVILWTDRSAGGAATFNALPQNQTLPSAPARPQ